MRKIDSIFIRDAAKPSRVTHMPTPGTEWVHAGEGTPTRKWDGTCCLIRDGRLYKRVEWDAQKGPAPASWLHWTFDPAQRSGHGWLPVGDDPTDWLHREAFARGIDRQGDPFKEGSTYELIGPKVQKNPERSEIHTLVPHGYGEVYGDPRTFDALKAYLESEDIEGIVWHHPDGRMAKIKARDFGIKRGGT